MEWTPLLKQQEEGEREDVATGAGKGMRSIMGKGVDGKVEEENKKFVTREV